ncbi:glycosyltransferase family 61 protein [Haloarcula amylolytica]|uniref:glycosyltransferase family 61 protein n=1 Tax=Haloarcula amylolytica TaxID=396317 RepID=UPI003C75CAEF
MLAHKIKNAYYRGGLKEVFHGACRLGIETAIGPRGNISIDGRQFLYRDKISNSTDEVENYWELPVKDGLEPLRESESKNPFDSTQEQMEFVQTRQYSYRPDFVCEVSDVRLLGPSGMGVTKNKKILSDSITMPNQPSRIQGAIQRGYIHNPLLTAETLHTTWRSSWRSSQTLDCACSLFNSWNNYYHWILEHLPKLRAVKFYKKRTGTMPTLIIPDNPPSFITETLEMLGFDPEDCIQWDSPAMDIERLILPGFPEANPMNLHWLRENLRTYDGSSTNLPSRIYISRKKAPKRRIENESELVSLLSKYGFERVLAEELSVKDQIRLFSNADVIIGQHGAGLTNMLWADDATIFEMHNEVIVDHYYVLANNLGHEYVPISAESKNPDNIHSDMVINIEDINQSLSGHV